MKLRLIAVLLLYSTLSSFHLKAQNDTIFSRFEVQAFNGKVGVGFTIRGGVLCSGVRVERSNDGQLFEPLYEFPGVCGSPGSDESYQWIDENPPANQLLHYRLELGSLGLFSTSRTVLVRKLSEGELLIYPSPCSNCNVEFYNPLSKPFEYRIYDLSGRLILNNRGSSDRITINLSFALSGVYILELLTENKTEYQKKFLIKSDL